MKLYEVSNEMAAILSRLDACDGELTPEDLAAITAMEATFAKKAQAVACVIREFEADAEAARQEAARLSLLAAVRTNVANRLKDYLLHQMQQTGQTKLSTPLFSLWVQRNGSPAIEHSGDLADLPPELVKTTISHSLDRKAVLNWISAGGELPSGVTITNGSHLRIK